MESFNRSIFYGLMFFFFFCKQKTAYDMRISDWSSDVCSSDLTSHNPPSLVQLPYPQPERKGQTYRYIQDSHAAVEYRWGHRYNRQSNAPAELHPGNWGRNSQQERFAHSPCTRKWSHS